MSSAREHHAKAEQLLEQARTTPDQISRREILAEAHVHATLALSAPGGTGPRGTGRDKAVVTSPRKPGPAHPGGDKAWRGLSSPSDPTS